MLSWGVFLFDDPFIYIYTSADVMYGVMWPVNSECKWCIMIGRRRRRYFNTDPRQYCKFHPVRNPENCSLYVSHHSIKHLKANGFCQNFNLDKGTRFIFFFVKRLKGNLANPICCCSCWALAGLLSGLALAANFDLLQCVTTQRPFSLRGRPCLSAAALPFV